MCVDSVKTLTEYSDILENLVPISLIDHYIVDVSSWVYWSRYWYVANASDFVKLITNIMPRSVVKFLYLDESLLCDNLPFNNL